MFHVTFALSRVAHWSGLRAGTHRTEQTQCHILDREKVAADIEVIMPTALSFIGDSANRSQTFPEGYIARSTGGRFHTGRLGWEFFKKGPTEWCSS